MSGRAGERTGGEDPFTRLGLPRRFATDEAAVRTAQRRALAQIHPDRERDPLRRELAMRESAAISAAAREVLDPVRRAECLLRLAGVGAAPPAPPELLMASLEWREDLEQARESGDTTAMAAVREPVERRLAEVMGELLIAIDGAAAGGEAPGAAPAPESASASDAPVVAEPQRAAALLTELRMLRRLLEEPSTAGDT